MQVDLTKYDTINLNNFTVESELSEENTDGDDLPQQDRIDKDIFCLRCGRKLLDYESRQIGMGPSCLKHYKESKNQRVNLLDIVKK